MEEPFLICRSGKEDLQGNFARLLKKKLKNGRHKKKLYSGVTNLKGARHKDVIKRNYCFLNEAFKI